jgi:hypothetical protein
MLSSNPVTRIRPRDSGAATLHRILTHLPHSFTPSWRARAHAGTVGVSLDGVMMDVPVNALVVAAFFLIVASGVRLANRF